jgi:hypothetical protein
MALSRKMQPTTKENPMHKDNLTFKVIKSDPVKMTVTLRPTFGTLIKINVAAAALVACSVIWTKMLLEDQYEVPVPTADEETPEES